MSLYRPIGLVALAVVIGPIALRRVWALASLVRAGSSNPERFRNIPKRVRYELTKVIGQKKLLQWSGPGLAHAFTFWGFLVIQVALLESVFEFFWADAALPLIGTHSWLGFTFDFFAAAVFTSLVAFALIRLKNNPRRLERRSRFYKSHMAPAYLILVMIGLVVTTLVALNATRHSIGHLPYADGAFLSRPIGDWLAARASRGALEVADYVLLMAHVGVVAVFLILVLYSKHLHIFTSPLNVLFGRHPFALGRLRPEHIDVEAMDENTKIGAGAVEDLEWKHMLDQLTCTECGRCQSVCPAWATGKELNPKLIVMQLRDHAFAKAPVLTGKVLAENAVGDTKVACEQSLVPDVISEEMLWACVTCGACVYECPVDIEHVDMIMDMRRHQVMMESRFPREAQGMLNNVESSGNPWGMGGDARMQWAKGMEDEVKVLEPGAKFAEDEYIFFVGCAGASDDRAIRTTRALARLLIDGGVRFAVLGPQETCNGDPARRLGNEFLFQEIAKANVEKFTTTGVRKIITQCPHCFNTLGKEYPDYGGTYEVVHHAQLLAELIAEGKLEPKTPLDLDVTYHDPCYLARHDSVMDDPRLVIRATGAKAQEMHRHGRRTFCCGAGGARFFMEETEGKRINVERIDEALGTHPNVVGTACPFCLVMLDDAVKDKQMQGVGEGVEVMDVATLLLRSMDGHKAPVTVGAPSAEGSDAPTELEAAETKVPPDEGAEAQS